MTSFHPLSSHSPHGNMFLGKLEDELIAASDKVVAAFTASSYVEMALVMKDAALIPMYATSQPGQAGCVCNGDAHDAHVDSSGIIERERGLWVIPDHFHFRIDKTDAIRSVTVVLPLWRTRSRSRQGLAG